MSNQPPTSFSQETTIGPLTLVLKTLKMGEVRRELLPALGYLPELIVDAASLPGEGIDCRQLADHLNERARRAGLEDRVTPEVVHQALVEAVMNIDQWISAFCIVIWLVADKTSGIAWPYPVFPPQPENPTDESLDEYQKAVEALLIPPAGTQWLDEMLLTASDDMEIWEAVCFYVELVRAILRRHFHAA